MKKKSRTNMRLLQFVIVLLSVVGMGRAKAALPVSAIGIKNHADVNALTNDGDTALQFAPTYEIAKALIDAGADINAVTTNEAGSTTIFVFAPGVGVADGDQ